MAETSINLDSGQSGGKSPTVRFFSEGAWLTMSMGEFIQLIVDSCLDDSVIARIAEDMPLDLSQKLMVNGDYVRGGERVFARRMEIWLVPNGAVLEQMSNLDANLVTHLVAAQVKEKLLS